LTEKSVKRIKGERTPSTNAKFRERTSKGGEVMGEAIITRRGGAGEAIVEFENFIGDRRENPGFQSGDERRLSVTN
jgi:hypothetical protein